MRAELRALHRPQVWLALGIGTVGFGGMFATYAYISPTMTELAGLRPATIPLVLALYGIGMTVGAFLSGRVARIGLLRGIIVILGAIAVMLALFGSAARQPVLALISVFFLGLLPSILVPMLQTRLMDVAHEGQSLAAALNHSTLNIANALGAWLGSVVLSAGLGYEWPSRVGAVLAVLGVLIALVSVLLERPRRRQAPSRRAPRLGRGTRAGRSAREHPPSAASGRRWPAGERRVNPPAGAVTWPKPASLRLRDHDRKTNVPCWLGSGGRGPRSRRCARPARGCHLDERRCLPTRDRLRRPAARRRAAVDPGHPHPGRAAGLGRRPAGRRRLGGRHRPGLRRVVAHGSTVTGPERDHTVKVDVTGPGPGHDVLLPLRPRRRARRPAAPAPPRRQRRDRPAPASASSRAPTGRPGYFSAYRHLAARGDLDAVLHLGDYIYEYGTGEYADGRHGGPPARARPTRSLTLADYRQRHAQYKTDPDLQALHAAVPWITTWDDHEVANDAWSGGAENHTPGTEGDWADRRGRRPAGLRRVDAGPAVRHAAGTASVYRRLQFGRLADLTMLDLRTYRGQQVATGRPGRSTTRRAPSPARAS